MFVLMVVMSKMSGIPMYCIVSSYLTENLPIILNQLWWIQLLVFTWVN